MPATDSAKDSVKNPKEAMELNNLSLAYLIEEIRPQIEGGFVNKIQISGNGLVKIKIHTREGSRDLIIAPNALFIAEHSFPAAQAKHHFIDSVKKIIYNKRILSISQHSFDRVVVFELPQHFLIAEVFGNGNIVLTDREFSIVAVKKTEMWKDRALKRGHKYIFPASKGISPLDLDERLGGVLPAPGTDIIRALVKGINISPAIAEEALSRLKIDKTTKTEKLTKLQISKIAAEIKGLYTVLPEKYAPVKAGAALLPFSLSSLQNQERIRSMGSCLDSAFVGAFQTEQGAEKSAGKAKEKGRAEHSYKQLLEAKEKMEKQSVLNKEKGEKLYGNFVQVEQVMDAVKKAIEKKVPEKEIMQKVNSALEKNSAALRLKKVDVKSRLMVVELND